MKYLFRENNNEVKVNKILDLYRKLLNETNNRSKCIMLIVPNATSKLNYERELNIDISEELNITTYISFIKREIIKFSQVKFKVSTLNKSAYFISTSYIQSPDLYIIFLYHNISIYFIKMIYS